MLSLYHKKYQKPKLSSLPCRQHLRGSTHSETRGILRRAITLHVPTSSRNSLRTKQAIKFRCASIADDSVHFPRIHSQHLCICHCFCQAPPESRPRAKMHRVNCVRDRTYRTRVHFISSNLDQCTNERWRTG